MIPVNIVLTLLTFTLLLKYHIHFESNYCHNLVLCLCGYACQLWTKVPIHIKLSPCVCLYIELPENMSTSCQISNSILLLIPLFKMSAPLKAEITVRTSSIIFLIFSIKPTVLNVPLLIRVSGLDAVVAGNCLFLCLFVFFPHKISDGSS